MGPLYSPAVVAKVVKNKLLGEFFQYFALANVKGFNAPGELFLELYCANSPVLGVVGRVVSEAQHRDVIALFCAVSVLLDVRIEFFDNMA